MTTEVKLDIYHPEKQNKKVISDFNKTAVVLATVVSSVSLVVCNVSLDRQPKVEYIQNVKVSGEKQMNKNIDLPAATNITPSKIFTLYGDSQEFNPIKVIESVVEVEAIKKASKEENSMINKIENQIIKAENFSLVFGALMGLLVLLIPLILKIQWFTTLPAAFMLFSLSLAMIIRKIMSKKMSKGEVNNGQC